jgi:2'-5' RNA ligase
MAEDPVRKTSARLFLAIPLYDLFPEEIEGVLRPLSRGIPGVRWVDPRQVHLTLHFFGSVSIKEIDLIDAFVQKVAKLFSPLTLSLDRIGGFPSLERPQIVWLGVAEPSGRLLSLQKAIQGEAQTLGFRVETRPYHPHATIGRVKRKIADIRDLVKAGAFLPTVAMPADHFVLYESHTFQEGVQYEVLKTYSFSKKA